MRLFLLTLLTMLAFAGNSILNRMAVGAGEIGPVEFAQVRVVAGAAMLLALVALRAAREGGSVWPGAQGRIVGAAALLVYLFGFSLAYGALDAGVGALILFGMVQITMFGGAILAAEVVPLRRWLGAGVAFAGLVLLLAPGGGAGLDWHALSMVAAGVGWGVYSLAGRGQTDALGATAWNFALAVPVALAAGLVLPGEGVTASATGLALAVLSGAVTSGLGYALWYAILPRLGAARAGVAQLTVPVLAAFGGALLLSEGVTLRFVLAALLVLGGVAMALLAPRG
jgi:drug/metabolite transporter (DMT)-like permease